MPFCDFILMMSYLVLDEELDDDELLELDEPIAPDIFRFTTIIILIK